MTHRGERRLGSRAHHGHRCDAAACHDKQGGYTVVPPGEASAIPAVEQYVGTCVRKGMLGMLWMARAANLVDCVDEGVLTVWLERNVRAIVMTGGG